MRFRNKIFISYILIVLLFLSVLIPYAAYSMNTLVEKAMEERSTELIEKIQGAESPANLVQRLKKEKATIFFRVSLISDKNRVLYDSHVKRLLGPDFNPDYIVLHQEVENARKHGKSYLEAYSKLFGQEFSYFAQKFDFQGKPYVLRIAFPYQYIQQITHDVEIGIVGLTLTSLILFSLMTWLVVNRLTTPIRHITQAIKPYQEGVSSSIPQISIPGLEQTDEFWQLAETLNSLSQKIQTQISSLIEERKEKEAILESLVEGVIAIDENQIIIYANPAAYDILKVTPQEVEGQSVEALKEPSLLSLLRRSESLRVPIVEPLNIRKEGIVRYLDVVAAPSKEKKGTLLVLQDKTEHYKIIEMRKDFIANASHELKTPIAIILGFAETLYDNPHLPKNVLQEITEKICHNSERMHNIVKDLLILADIENLPSSRLIPCDVSLLLEDCQAHVLQVFPDTAITIHKSDEPVILVGDQRLLDLAITNLMENAAKYSERPAKITLFLEKSLDVITLKIQDKGIGIPKEDLPHIFQRFYTVNKARSRKMGGSGLGLSIVETIIEKHFGEINVESELGKGTTFTITLPEKKLV